MCTRQVRKLVGSSGVQAAKTAIKTVVKTAVKTQVLFGSLILISLLLSSCNGFGLGFKNDIRIVIVGQGSVAYASYDSFNRNPDIVDSTVCSEASCDVDHSTTFEDIRLTAKAKEGWQFVKWEDEKGLCSTDNVCVLKHKNGDTWPNRREFKATFEEIQTKPVIASFTASPESIESGKSSTLSWTVTGSQPITVSVSGLGEQTGSSVSVSPTSTTTYTLTAKNSVGTVTKEVIIGVTAPPLPPVLNACEKLRASLNDNNALQVDMITSTNFVDPDGHLEFIFDVEPTQVKATAEAVIRSMILTFGTTDVMASFASTSLSATGTFQPDGNTACKIDLKRIAEIAETPGTEVVLEGSISADGKTMTGSYSFGTNGTLPGGKPAKIEFELKLKKVSLG